MQAQQQHSHIAIDLTRAHRRTVTSFYSNLVTRPTGRAVRLGVEQQLVDLGRGTPCLSVLDFSQVRVLDYSCADEIVAKLLLRYREEDRPVDAYFMARGLQDHHLESIEAVLERHGLLLIVDEPAREPTLLGSYDTVHRECWRVLVRRGRAGIAEVASASGLRLDEVRTTLERFIATRVAVGLADGAVCPVPRLHGA